MKTRSRVANVSSITKRGSTRKRALDGGSGFLFANRPTLLPVSPRIESCDEFVQILNDSGHIPLLNSDGAVRVLPVVLDDDRIPFVRRGRRVVGARVRPTDIRADFGAASVHYEIIFDLSSPLLQHPRGILPFACSHGMATV